MVYRGAHGVSAHQFHTKWCRLIFATFVACSGGTDCEVHTVPGARTPFAATESRNPLPHTACRSNHRQFGLLRGLWLISGEAALHAL